MSTKRGLGRRSPSVQSICNLFFNLGPGPSRCVLAFQPRVQHPGRYPRLFLSGSQGETLQTGPISPRGRSEHKGQGMQLMLMSVA